LRDILVPESEVPEEFLIPEKQLKDWTYLKGGKKEKRTNKANGFSYNYAEGAMTFPDALDKPSRTIITGEGGATPSRFKHVAPMSDGRLRRLMPVEIERLNMFPDGHTEGASDSRRAFLMGNALVTGVIERTGKALEKRLKG
jgi:DNA (cytosine-5)-methyltransferase 1